jgi:hypothetical protein
LIKVGIVMRKTNTMGLMKRMKNWLLPQAEDYDSPTAHSPPDGTAVAGFVQRVADVDIISSSNMMRPHTNRLGSPLAVLLPPAIAAATPWRTIPLFLVSSAVEPAEVDIIQLARPSPKLLLVHNIDRVDHFDRPVTAFMLAARLASNAKLNTVAGKKPGKQPTRQCATTLATALAKARAMVPNRPTAKPLASKLVAATSKAPQCYVRLRSTGQAIVMAVPKRTKIRTR